MGNTVRGGNSAISIFASLLNGGQFLKEKNLLLQEQIFFLSDLTPILKGFDFQGNRKSQELFPFVRKAEKIWKCVQLYLKENYKLNMNW